jgi:hypothetical protein
VNIFAGATSRRCFSSLTGRWRSIRHGPERDAPVHEVDGIRRYIVGWHTFVSRCWWITPETSTRRQSGSARPVDAIDQTRLRAVTIGSPPPADACRRRSLERTAPASTFSLISTFHAERRDTVEPGNFFPANSRGQRSGHR